MIATNGRWSECAPAEQLGILKRAKFPAKHIDTAVDRDGYWRPVMWRLVSRLLDRRGGITVIHGGYGTGKTQAVTEVARVLAATQDERDNGCRYVTANEFCDGMMEHQTDRASFYVATFASPLLLVIDECDRNWTEWQAGRLTDLIDRRYRARDKHTWLITNKEPPVLMQYLGGRVEDRWIEGGRHAVEFSGPSRREKGQDA